jgi:hypothetical protein
MDERPATAPTLRDVALRCVRDRIDRGLQPLQERR